VTARRAFLKAARSGLSVLALVGAVAGCESFDLGSGSNGDLTREIEKIFQRPGAVDAGVAIKKIPPAKINTESRKFAAAAVEAIRANDLEKASEFTNNALRLEITNSYLQFLNGYVYHLEANNGDATKLPLAQQGYELAVQFDETNWLARYYLGILHLDQRDWARAQKHFAEALHYNGDDPGILYNLGVASYYAEDPVTADGSLRKLREIGDYGKDARVLRASSMVMAALGEHAKAAQFLDLYKKAADSKGKVAAVDRRIKDWNQFHQRFGVRTPAQMVQVEQPAGMAADPNAMQQPADQGAQVQQDQPAADAQPAEPQPIDANGMVIVDVVIIRTEENYTTSRGVNLINGLTLQFGSSSASTAAFSYAKTQNPLGSSTDDGTRTTIVRSLNIPGITYSLNIANTNTTRNEILARPTLVALNGQPSEFFSGVNINAAAVGGAGDGSTVQIEKEIGVKLTVTPEFLEDGRVKLAVTAERTFLTTPNTSSVTFTLRIDTSKTNVNANVAMRYGETLILSGLSEKETERKRDGVPGLQDVPLLQYFFSKRNTTDFQKSVLILLTPRPTPYVYQNEKARADTNRRLSRDERVLSELQARYSDWFRPYPNWASVFHHMQANKLYREFRTGDVALEKWENLETRGNRLNHALDFLFF
jgi:Flp pilus assembly secretin CpaC